MSNTFSSFLEVLFSEIDAHTKRLRTIHSNTSMFSLLGLVGYPSDDINKFLWMVRIGGGVFPHIKEPDYLVSGFLDSYSNVF